MGIGWKSWAIRRLGTESTHRDVEGLVEATGLEELVLVLVWFVRGVN